MLIVLFGGFVLLFAGVALAKSSDKREVQDKPSGDKLLSVGFDDSTSPNRKRNEAALVDKPGLVIAQVMMGAGFLLIVGSGAILIGA
jgi:hypothetical protein